ncbi:hypothetical protein [Rhodopseudomonas sp. BR0G17]|uniref:hypothetical protein n=1 Tax=Rhodopseudomonas sp. BR0G17 TaxID=2269368 RepID=UPI0013DF93AD|nr:hypothetical protein [Rhodopseudomonas sp. BR0G17]NEW99191.1 hypothetical protein [Rhodopseudomonas sp. BR0G17]
MTACLNVEEWCKSTRDEVLKFAVKKRSKAEEGKTNFLAVRQHLRPVDVYSYLRARFGEPNGFQNFLRRDDSDNLIHWDFQLKAGTEDVYICGHLREIHIALSEALTDLEWQTLIKAIKSDYHRVAKAKSKITHSFEKYVVFQNKYLALSDLCADLHARISEAATSNSVDYKFDDSEEFKKEMNRRSSQVAAVFNDCLTLRLLMPIMAESYINMLILTFCRREILDDKERYNRFLRAKIPQRLRLLSENCDGFEKTIDKDIPGYSNFMNIFNQRNFALHGNVSPLQEQIETIYFEGRRPLFVNPGNSIEMLFAFMEKHADRHKLLEDYEQLHTFLHEVTKCLSADKRAFFEHVISDAYPGFRMDLRRPTRLLPDHYVWSGFPGIPYDDQLAVEW